MGDSLEVRQLLLGQSTGSTCPLKAGSEAHRRHFTAEHTLGITSARSPNALHTFITCRSPVVKESFPQLQHGFQSDFCYRELNANQLQQTSEAAPLKSRWTLKWRTRRAGGGGGGGASRGQQRGDKGTLFPGSHRHEGCTQQRRASPCSHSSLEEAKTSGRMERGILWQTSIAFCDMKMCGREQ